MNCDEVDALFENQERLIETLTAALTNLVHAADKAGVCDDVLVHLFPDQTRNGQPMDAITKAAQRAMNEARTALAQARKGTQP